ncbi:MAG: hypothetical protein PHY94_04960 [Candidatus Omnitrophica bacterium]|nr:hypothetical protein [Candidatus Omnitrophota bacterium]
MKNKFRKFITIVLAFIVAVLFVVKFAGPRLLQFYIETGVGSCRKIPILCMMPVQQVVFCQPDKKEALNDFIPHTFPKMSLAIPKGFNVVQETIKKVYFKKGLRRYSGPVIYVLFKERDFFIGLFPQLKTQGVTNNYEFLKRTMFANLNNIQGITDAFFVIMKGIFIPDLGDQNNVQMIGFTCMDKKGFINYNLGKKENYFDCNVIDQAGNFYKIYIKDKAAVLNLSQVVEIMATLEAK